MRLEEYYYNKRRYKINYLTDSEWKAKTKKWNWFKRTFVRGFTELYSSGVYFIYIKDSAKIGREKLILHEIGHVLRKKHTWLPTLMNPTWVFRWIKWM